MIKDEQLIKLKENMDKKHILMNSPEIIALYNECQTLVEFIRRMYVDKNIPDDIVTQEVICMGEDIYGSSLEPWNWRTCYEV